MGIGLEVALKEADIALEEDAMALEVDMTAPEMAERELAEAMGTEQSLRKTIALVPELRGA